MNARTPWRASALILIAVLAMLTTISPATSSASQPSMSAFVSADSVQVVEPFTFTVSVQADNGARVAFPELQNKLGPFDIRDVQDALDVPHASDANLRTWTRSFTLESIETGDLHVPPLNLQITQAGKTSQLATEPIAVRVVSVLEDRSDPTQFRDIQPVIDVASPEPPPTRVVPWTELAAMSLLAVALCICVVVYRRRRWTTPYTWAKSQVDALAPDNPNVAHQLSQILHEFLMLQFEMSDTGSLERGRSAQEIVQTLLKQHRISASTGQRLSTLFDLTEQAKFAGLRLSLEDTKSALAGANELLTALAPSGSKGSGSRQHTQP